MKKLMTFLGALTVMFAMSNAHAAVILYSEDFEGAGLPATILDAPIGYTSVLGTADVPITTTSSLNATQVADGPATTSATSGAMIGISTLTLGQVYTLTADMFTLSGSNSGIGLSNGIFGNNSGAYLVETGGGWLFDLRGITTADVLHFFPAPTGIGEAVSATIILDLSVSGSEVATGEIVHSGGTLSYTEPITDLAALATINSFTIQNIGTGVAVDNIILSSVPEPSSMSLMALGMLPAFRRRR